MPKGRKLRIGFVTIWYPVAMSRYICDAFRRRPDCEVFTAGPYTEDWIPWGGGMRLPRNYVFTPDLPIAWDGRFDPTVSYSVIEASLPGAQEIDLWVEGNAGLHSIGRPSRGIFVGIGTDPHVLNYDRLRERADIFYSMQHVYMKGKDRWLPYAYDPTWHAPTALAPPERTYDAALIGLHYPHRDALISRLRGLGWNVYYGLGPAYEDARTIYHSTRVGLNWSSMSDMTARVFELMAFGIAPLINVVPDLDTFFKEGVHYYGFNTLDEAVMKAEALLADPAQIAALGAEARKAVEPHTWDARAEQILRDTGLIS